MSGNVSISIGRIDRAVLVAWHEHGKIRTRRIELDVAPFKAQLPELRSDPAANSKVWREIRDGILAE